MAAPRFCERAQYCLCSSKSKSSLIWSASRVFGPCCASVPWEIANILARIGPVGSEIAMTATFPWFAPLGSSECSAPANCHSACSNTFGDSAPIYHWSCWLTWNWGCRCWAGAWCFFYCGQRCSGMIHPVTSLSPDSGSSAPLFASNQIGIEFCLQCDRYSKAFSLWLGCSYSWTFDNCSDAGHGPSIDYSYHTVIRRLIGSHFDSWFEHRAGARRRSRLSVHRCLPSLIHSTFYWCRWRSLNPPFQNRPLAYRPFGTRYRH